MTTTVTRPRARAPQQEEPPRREDRALRPRTSPRSPQLEGNPHGDGDPTQPKINVQINKAIF